VLARGGAEATRLGLLSLTPHSSCVRGESGMQPAATGKMSAASAARETVEILLTMRCAFCTDSAPIMAAKKFRRF
jgi:hypothetical protein